MRVNLTLAVASFALVAGCLGAEAPNEGPSPDASVDDPWSPPKPSHDFSAIIDPDHQLHGVAALHTNGAGVTLAGHTLLGDLLPDDYAAAFTQIDVWNGWAVIAGYHNGPSFVILDVSDPTDPEPVSYFPNVADGNSARFSKDGQYLFFGCQVGQEGTIGKECGAPEDVRVGPTTSGVSVFDVSDKAKPVFVDFEPDVASHNVQTQWINGKDYVFTNAVDIIEFDRESKKLTKVANVGGNHDATVAQHPVTGDWLLYTGAAELAIYNVNDPADPEEVLSAGAWTSGVGWHDQVPFPELVDGRALLALGGEYYTGTPDQPIAGVTIADITDPGNPIKLSYWEPPFAAVAPWAFYQFSIHEMAAHKDGQLAISWNHGGVWVLDVSTQERQAEPVVLAAYQPHEALDQVPHGGAQAFVPQVPRVWSVAWDARGYLMLPDMFTGFYVLEPEWGLRPGYDGGA